ncbi:PTS sugar transporter subunit IIA, partial [Helcococcus ovis]
YSEGLLSSAELIAGKQENVGIINFLEGMSQEDVKEKIENYIEDKNNVLILVDLLGGTPFKMASMVVNENSEKNLNVVTGMNLNMLLEAVFNSTEENIDVLTSSVKSAAISGIDDLRNILNPGIEEDDVFEDGI